MTTKKLRLADLQQQLSRTEMKQIMAGGGLNQGLSGTQGYMCCWSGTTNCSICQPAARPDCVSGATAVEC
ncbi:MAG: hypothetical protein EKK39_02710 [Sphingobacteriales bacterium]|uniref:hypothetical protein n=1 Tax=Hydrotalea flava TaxID=714549 RepID=UPI0008343B24|nr:hypothetical protein [Hydrotalea flava]RTL55513.1 MAG: hypothetical protein EKK39_02710 [Sphingobacteriales bacterium]